MDEEVIVLVWPGAQWDPGVAAELVEVMRNALKDERRVPFTAWANDHTYRLVPAERGEQ